MIKCHRCPEKGELLRGQHLPYRWTEIHRITADVNDSSCTYNKSEFYLCPECTADVVGNIAPAKKTWIRVEDGLPERNGKTLFSLPVKVLNNKAENREVWVTKRLLPCDNTPPSWADRMGCPDPCHITHWMTISELPKRK